jgi:hypothetical protein
MQASRWQAVGLKRLAEFDRDTGIHTKALCCRACESPDLTLSGNERSIYSWVWSKLTADRTSYAGFASKRGHSVRLVHEEGVGLTRRRPC